jgi:extracellular elastinolytic metalloproteinase
MRLKPPGTIVVLAATLIALALVPGSISAQSAGSTDPLDIALSYLDKNAADLGVTSADVADVFVTSNYRSAHSGVTHVNLNQRFQALEVLGGHTTVSVAADGSVVFAGGSLARLDAASGTAGLEPTEAVVAAAEGLDLADPTDLRVLSESRSVARETVVSGGGISAAPIPLHLGWQPTGSGLRLAWQLVIDATSGDSLWNAAVDAETGALLDAEDWTSKDSLTELAATLARPSVPAPRSLVGTSTSSIVTPNPVNDGSSYRVLEFPTESPNDADRSLVTNPADANASPFGWHDTNGAAGAEFTTTQGNNAHAYLDQDSSNSPDSGGTPDGGAGLDFDFPIDFAEHAQNYREAVVTNLFYGNNTFHDIMHGLGFDEPSGNFQANNYGRGGTGGDYVRAEAADGNGTNNANFSTPAADGGTPRMQMFLWPGNQFGAQNQVVVNGVGSFDSSWARFSPAPTVAGDSGQLIDAGTGCAPADYASAPAGDWIAIVTGSNLGCQNVEKARQASTAGAEALIIALNAAGSAPILTGSLAAAPPTIPVASITQADGNTIRAAIAGGTTTGTVRKHPNHPGIRDGDLENGIIIHEYGHGVSNRLTGGPGINCLSGNEQAGEGWSDYYAITMLLDPALDDPNEPRGMGPYALFQDDRHGAGIRPRPYSRDMAIQPFTYDSIKTGGWLNGTSLALPHGLGHGWASVLWDLDWDLIDKHGFNPDLYGAWDSGGNNRSLQYVTDGLKLQGCGPGLVVARAAIIAAADELSEGEDTCTVWATFARRGLGFSAVQGTTNRDDNQEAFDTHPDCHEGFLGGIADQPSLNIVNGGANRDMEFTLGGNHGLDILASDNPYSRMVDCTTLRTIDPSSPFITPRPIPVPAQSPGNSGLTYDAAEDVYTFPWKTLREWNGSCREFVLTRKDGVQHRAYFRFGTDPSFPVSGHVRGTDGQPIAGATVSFTGTQTPITTTTDANGFYSFASIVRGPYTASASAGGCIGSETKPVVVQGPTTVDFTLPQRSDSFGYSCEEETTAFTEAANVLALTGDDAALAVPLPFPFTYYGQQYNTAFVATNGHVNFNALSTAITNAAVPSTGTPNAAIYPFWDDLFVDASASVRTELVGSAPNRRFVIEWRNVHFFGNTSQRIDVSLVLHENGEILTQQRNLADDVRERGSSATLGIENATGTVGLQFSFNSPVLQVEPAVNSIRYRPPS